MTAQKIIWAGVAGGIVYFLFGWLFYGILLVDFFASHAGSATDVYREMDEMIMWALMLGNLLMGFLVAIIFNWSQVKSIGDGVLRGAIIGLLVGGSMDFSMYGTSNLMTLGGAIADIITMVVMSAIVGLVVVWILKTGKKASE